MNSIIACHFLKKPKLIKNYESQDVYSHACIQASLKTGLHLSLFVSSAATHTPSGGLPHSSTPPHSTAGLPWCVPKQPLLQSTCQSLACYDYWCWRLCLLLASCKSFSARIPNTLNSGIAIIMLCLTFLSYDSSLVDPMKCMPCVLHCFCHEWWTSVLKGIFSIWSTIDTPFLLYKTKGCLYCISFGGY